MAEALKWGFLYGDMKQGRATHRKKHGGVWQTTEYEEGENSGGRLRKTELEREMVTLWEPEC